jgi:Ca2+-binding RTX toxin-like protein
MLLVPAACYYGSINDAIYYWRRASLCPTTERTGMRRRAILLLVAMGAVLVLSSGVALALNTIRCQLPEDYYCYGTSGDDRMLGNDDGQYMAGYGGSDVLRGFEGEDVLHGGEDDDRMFGGEDGDWISPGPGDDAVRGGEGADYYEFVDYPEEDGWGHDTLTETPTGDDDYLVFYSNGGLTIDLDSSEERHEVTDTDGTSTVDWPDDVIDATHGSRGDDTIRGNAAANRILAVNFRHDPAFDSMSPQGSDEVFAEGGDDEVWVRDYEPDHYGYFDPDEVSKAYRDRVDCGAGIDEVHYDVDDRVKNCEVKHPHDPDDYQY